MATPTPDSQATQDAAPSTAELMATIAQISDLVSSLHDDLAALDAEQQSHKTKSKANSSTPTSATGQGLAEATKRYGSRS